MINKIEFQGCEKMKELIRKLKTIEDRVIYKIKKKTYNLLYRRATYIPKEGLWVLTAVFPKEIADGIYGVTDVFPGDKKKISSTIPLHSVYIEKISDAVKIHKDVVELIIGGNIGNGGEYKSVLKNEVEI